MRIISGELGGRSLRSLPTESTRPAMAKTRESLFSMLVARGINWSDCRVLDLFAGTGSLAFEALSRGAAHAVLVDNGKEQCACISQNIIALGVEDRCHLQQQDVSVFLRKQPARSFELVFIDPPYRRDFVSPCLVALSQNAWLARGAFVVAEIERGAAITVPAKLEQLVEKVFGQTVLKIWTYDENSTLPGHI